MCIRDSIDSHLSYWLQVGCYIALYLTMGGINAFAYASTAGRLQSFFERPAALRRLKLASAAFLLFAAVLTAMETASALGPSDETA